MSHLKPDKTPVLIELPNELLAATRRGVKAEDTDRSKFIRSAIREKLERIGIEHDLSHAAAHAQCVNG